MRFDAIQFLTFGSVAAFAVWVWRFSSILRKTPRDMRAAALRGSARAMGSEFWERGNHYQDELADEFTIDPNSIVHSLQWPNTHVQIFSFQEVHHFSKGRTSYLYWVGYRFDGRPFPRFDLKPTRTVSFLRRGWWRKVSLPGQIEFESRFALTGESSALIEQFFTPGRCAAILSRESDSETSVSKEIQELSSLVTGMLPVAEALTDAQLVEQPQRYVGLSQNNSNSGRPWWDRLAFLLLGTAIAISILLSVFFLGAWWERFDQTILKTEARRYLFAAFFISVLFAIGEWLVRSYHRTKKRAATQLEAHYSVFLN